MILHRIINKIKRVRALRNGDAYVKYIRKLGVEIGEDELFSDDVKDITDLVEELVSEREGKKASK